MLQKGFSDIRLSAVETTDCDTLHHYPIRNDDGEYIDADAPYCTMDYIFTYEVPALKAQQFQVVTSRIALCSSDHCPLIGAFIW